LETESIFFIIRTTEEATQDLVLINGLTFVAKTLHDSISALTFEDEKRQISELILNFVKRVSIHLSPLTLPNKHIESLTSLSSRFHMAVTLRSS